MSEEYITRSVHDAELETVLVAVDKTNERIDDLRSSMNERLGDIKEANSRGMAMLTIALSVVQIAIAIVLYLLK